MKPNSLVTMKTTIAILIHLVVVPLFAAVPSTPTELVIGLSPFYAPVQQAEVRRALVTLALERAPLGTRITLWDAWNLTSIAVVEVPADIKADNPRARLMRMPKVSAIMAWFNALTNNSGPAELRGTAVTKIPEWLELISAPAVGGQRSILLLCSPIYVNLTEPSFSMSEGRYPSDGHLACKLAESVFGLAEKNGRLAGASVHWCYLAEKVWENDLQRTAVTRFWGCYIAGQSGTMATFQADLNTAIANALKANLNPCGRFQIDPEDNKPVMRTARPRQVPDWLQEARPEAPSVLTPATPVQTSPQRFTNSVAVPRIPQPEPVRSAEPQPATTVNSVLQPAVTNAPALPAETVVAPQSVTEKASASDFRSSRGKEALAEKSETEVNVLTSAATNQESDSRAVPIVNPPAAPPIFPSVVQVAAPAPVSNPLPIQPANDKTGAGILWDADVDLDLYVKAHPNARELFYRCTISREGRYFFDYRNRNSHLDYEYVELRNPVDLGQVEVWVNYYKGKAPSPTGKICLHYGGKTYVGTFALAATRGNHGGDAHRRATSPYWTELKLMELVSSKSQP